MHCSPTSTTSTHVRTAHRSIFTYCIELRSLVVLCYSYRNSLCGGANSQSIRNFCVLPCKPHSSLYACTDALEYPTCELVVEGPATAEVAPAQDFSSTASTGTTKADAHRTGPRHSNSDNRKHSKYVSPQAAMLLQMHSRVRSAPAYLHYRARIARDAQLSSVLSSDLSSDLSSGPGSDSSSGPRSAASFNEQVTSDIGISGSAKTDTDYSQYALGANWDVSVIRAHSNAASAQEVHVGVGRDHSGEPAGKKRGSATTLSEESEFAYDPCAETYINGTMSSTVQGCTIRITQQFMYGRSDSTI